MERTLSYTIKNVPNSVAAPMLLVVHSVKTYTEASQF